MIMGDKKKVAALIVARLKKPEAGSMKEANQGAFKDRAGASEEKPKVAEGKLTASEEMIQAIKSGDAEGFALALEDFIAMVQEEPSEEAEGEDEERHPILG